MRLDLTNTTAFRLSVVYTLLVTLAVGVTLGSAYLLTESRKAVVLNRSSRTGCQASPRST